MSTSVTRRAALGVLGISGAAFLAACSSESAHTDTTTSAAAPAPTSATPSATAKPSATPSVTATPSATPSPTPTPTEDDKDYSGVAKIDQYDYSVGKYEEATADHPARNVPLPVMPEAMKKDSAAGFAAALGFFSATVDYLIRTGDTQYLKMVSTDESTLTELQKYADRTKEGEANKTWYLEPNTTLTIKAPRPVYAEGSWNWQVDLSIDLGPKFYDRGELKDTPADKRYVNMSGEAVGTFINNIWDLQMDIN